MDQTRFRSLRVAIMALMAGVGCDPTGPVAEVDLSGDWHSVPGLPVSPLAEAKAYSFLFTHTDTTLTGTWTAFGDRGPVVPRMRLGGLVEGSAVGFTMTLETFNVTCFASPEECPPRYYAFVGTMDHRDSMSGTMYPADSAQFAGGSAHAGGPAHEDGWRWRLYRSRH